VSDLADRIRQLDDDALEKLIDEVPRLYDLRRRMTLEQRAAAQSGKTSRLLLSIAEDVRDERDRLQSTECSARIDPADLVGYTTGGARRAMGS